MSKFTSYELTERYKEATMEARRIAGMLLGVAQWFDKEGLTHCVDLGQCEDSCISVEELNQKVCDAIYEHTPLSKEEVWAKKLRK